MKWDLFPLLFECTNAKCKRVQSYQDVFQAINKAGLKLRCKEPSCNRPVRQLRFVTAHNCGALTRIFSPKCDSCGYDHLWFNDTGSFATSDWRCRRCSAVLQGGRFAPCDCGQYGRGGKTPFKRGYTTRDKGIWYPQTITVLNISDESYNNLQKEAERHVVTLASFFGNNLSIASGLREIGGSSKTNPLTEAEWNAQEQQLRTSGVPDDTIAELRKIQFPQGSGARGAVAGISAAALELGATRQFVERAALFDSDVVTDQMTLDDVALQESGRAPSLHTEATHALAHAGISGLSVTEQFPIALAAYGYTRVDPTPGGAHLVSFAKKNTYDGKHPIFTVPANTEALIVSLSALDVTGFLIDRGETLLALPTTERDARRLLLEIFAVDPDTDTDSPAALARRLTHTISHTLLRSLDDGETGFGESSLAEWVSPETLTAAIYVASFNDFPLGAFRNLLERRVRVWIRNSQANAERCDNDPLCSHRRPHASCDRCLHMTFGCRYWNANLDRRLLREFWRFTARKAAPDAP